MLRVVEPFTVAIVLAVGIASFAPVRGEVAEALDLVSTFAIALLFFLQGARLSRDAIVRGLGNVKLHTLVFGSTFVVFPLVAVLLSPLTARLVPEEIGDGVLFLAALPATIQSAVVFTSVARGNVAAAVCSASLSSVIGAVVTPLVLRVLGVGDASVAISWTQVQGLALELVLPLVVGHLARPWIGKTVEANRSKLRIYDQGTLVFLVYLAFSDAVVEGLFSTLSPSALAGLVVIDAILLAVLLAFTTFTSRAIGLSKEDEITAVFCGSKKSLASGVPMATILFAPSVAGTMIVPTMIFHQMQLMVCAVLARRYADRPADPPPPPAAPAPPASA